MGVDKALVKASFLLSNLSLRMGVENILLLFITFAGYMYDSA